jgi:hypothetical protein
MHQTGGALERKNRTTLPASTRSQSISYQRHFPELRTRKQTSFGAQAEFLVTRFQRLITPSEATCLVASTTCVVHKGALKVPEMLH